MLRSHHQTYHVFFNGVYLLCHPVPEEGVPPAPLRDFDDEKGQHWEAVPPRTEPDRPRYSWPGHPVCLVNSFVLILIWCFLLVYISSWWMLEKKGLNLWSVWVFDDDYSFVNEGWSLKEPLFHLWEPLSSYGRQVRLQSPTLRDGVRSPVYLRFTDSRLWLV